MTKAEKQIIALQLASLKTLASIENKVDILVSEVYKQQDEFGSVSKNNQEIVNQLREIINLKENKYYQEKTDLAAVMYASLGHDFEIN